MVVSGLIVEQQAETRRRSDAGQVRLSGRDVTGLVLCAEHYAAQYDLRLRRDGGMADLLAEAMAPDPCFSVVVVEEIERASRDFHDSVVLERRLSEQGIPLLATDEPPDVTGLSPTMILVRRIKQGVAEWYRVSLKAKTRKGLEEHAIAGWNTGTVPYGYKPDRVIHSVPVKAQQGRTRTRLAVDPDCGQWVTQMFEWRTLEKLSARAIALRLDAAGAPSPDGTGWSYVTVTGILANPKYTGRMVYGRTKNTGKSQRPGQRKVRAVPVENWIWSPEPTHPALTTRETWKEAQRIGKEHNGVRDAEVPTRQPGRRYALRSRIHCAQCGRRMAGMTRQGRKPGQSYRYYTCPWSPTNPRDVARHPDHVRAALREDTITTAISGFLDTYALGHDRDAFLADRLPKNAADEAANRDAKAAELGRQLARNEAASKGLITELAQLGDNTSSASIAYRTRIRQRFEELYEEDEALKAQLAELSAQAATVGDAALIEQLPHAPGLLAQAPDDIREALFAAFQVHCTYRADQKQVTIRATITDTTPGIVAALLADPRTRGDSPNGPAGPFEAASLTNPQATNDSAKRSPEPFAQSNAASIEAKCANEPVRSGVPALPADSPRSRLCGSDALSAASIEGKCANEPVGGGGLAITTWGTSPSSLSKSSSRSRPRASTPPCRTGSKKQPKTGTTT